MDYVNTIEDNIDFRDIRYESINQMANGNWQ
ncbi:hypothetical protein T06_14687 [Trichinella sp. T6]|nr:hypothetical protein T06_14687 [Trichinella sp. T6]